MRANDYNPNSVPNREMRLLKTSILADGFTMPIVTLHDEERDEYVIVDGYHRYVTGHDEEVMERTGGMLPVVVIDKPLAERMASTVRHNRARGAHAMASMGDIVFRMLSDGWSDERIIDQLGMTTDELVRLKHVTGYAKLYEDSEYSGAWIPGGRVGKAMRKRLDRQGGSGS